MPYKNIILPILLTAAVTVACTEEKSTPEITVTTFPATEITNASAMTGGRISPDETYDITSSGIVWGLQPSPDIETGNNTESIVSGNLFSVVLEGLSKDTKYYCRAYFYADGQLRYGNEISFRTLADDGFPTVMTIGVSDITENSAIAEGELVSDNGKKLLDKGFVWSTEKDPTLENGKSVSAGRGNGKYSSSITGLESKKEYYIRAYATNTSGTSYGESISFTTGIDPVITFNIKGSIFKMIYVKGGTFRMGATEEQGEDGQDYEKPVHNVTLKDYYICMTEVTGELWELVTNGKLPSLEDDPTWIYRQYKPATLHDWYACEEFAKKVSEITGKKFRLPTEAEWEYAARGGHRSRGYKYSGSNNFDEVGWSYDNPVEESEASLMLIAMKKPNELGIYDMSGNAMEWCSDWYELYSEEDQENPTGPATGSSKVLRGGSFMQNTHRCRVAHRGNGLPDNPMSFTGMRLVMEL